MKTPIYNLEGSRGSQAMMWLNYQLQWIYFLLGVDGRECICRVVEVGLTGREHPLLPDEAEGGFVIRSSEPRAVLARNSKSTDGTPVG